MLQLNSRLFRRNALIDAQPLITAHLLNITTYNRTIFVDRQSLVKQNEWAVG